MGMRPELVLSEQEVKERFSLSRNQRKMLDSLTINGRMRHALTGSFFLLQLRQRHFPYRGARAARSRLSGPASWNQIHFSSHTLLLWTFQLLGKMIIKTKQK